MIHSVQISLPKQIPLNMFFPENYTYSLCLLEWSWVDILWVSSMVGCIPCTLLYSVLSCSSVCICLWGLWSNRKRLGRKITVRQVEFLIKPSLLSRVWRVIMERNMKLSNTQQLVRKQRMEGLSMVWELHFSLVAFSLEYS